MGKGFAVLSEYSQGGDCFMEGSLKELAAIIKDSSLCREKSDYDDFYVAGKAEAEEQLRNAQYFVRRSKGM